MKAWTKKEEDKLKELFSLLTQNDILLLFPERTWRSIVWKASMLGLTRNTPYIIRFLEKVNIHPNIFGENDKYPTECWAWVGAQNGNGYGVFYAEKRYYAHRFSYEYFDKLIPDNLLLDHLCRNRACVNPGHLEPVTILENLKRGNTFIAKECAATHCPYGHPYDEVNTRYDKYGYRHCKECNRTVHRRN